MQTVPTGWTAESRDETRSIIASSLVSWKKELDSTYRLFTIGVSLIGGGDYIASSGEINSDWNHYFYFDESANLLNASYERELQMPVGGLAQAVADVDLSNTSGRYYPDYMGGNSELYTSVYKPRRPIIVNTGFNYSGIDHTIPQFVGITTKPPEVTRTGGKARLQASDFINFLQNQYVDNEVMFTGLRTDEIIEDILVGQGFSTAQFNLDYGINLINFGLFERGSKWGEHINKLVQAEYGHFYQDEAGVIRFENRQHWDSSPYTEVQKVLYTAMVIEAKMPDDDHIINVVEIKGTPRAKYASGIIFSGSGFAGSGAIEVPAGGNKVQWITYDDPILEIEDLVRGTTSTTTSHYFANSQEDNNGLDRTADIFIKSIDNFAKASKITFGNTSSSPAFVTKLDIYGRAARRSGDIYIRNELSSSVTVYEERPFMLENEFIQSSDWASSLSQLITRDFGTPEKLQELTIRGLPELQMGDLVSWQGRYWRIFGIKTKIDPSAGLIQDLKLLQRDIISYFRIGISTIGGGDQIAA